MKNIEQLEQLGIKFTRSRKDESVSIKNNDNDFIEMYLLVCVISVLVIVK